MNQNLWKPKKSLQRQWPALKGFSFLHGKTETREIGIRNLQTYCEFFSGRAFKVLRELP